ncbi:glycosyltransferase family 2 protein [[Eubacterium] cellulosolvens]
MKVVCVIPAHNEESTISSVVRNARTICNIVIVVDDGSTDRTVEEAKKAKAKVVSHTIRLGVGAALSTGLRAAINYGAEIIVTLDADEQHDPKEIPNVITPIIDGKADLVIGSRTLEKNSEMPFQKLVANKILSKLTSLASDIEIKDSQSGFRGMSRKVAESIKYDSTDYQWASEMIILLSKRGIKIVDVPIKTLYFKSRRRGAGFRDAIKILYNILSR